MFNEAGQLLTQGCRLAEIEDAMRAFGFAMGPFEFMDAIGIDTLYLAAAILIPRLPTPPEPSLLLHAMHRAGWFGRKSGRGFYCYASVDAAPTPNEQLDGLIEQYSRPRPSRLEPEEIVRRLLVVMVNQSADLLAEAVVADPDDVDLAMNLGAGFPEHQGGLLFWARRRGMDRLVADMKRWREESAGERRYRLSARFESLARSST
jgi:3-hydroxyacyl-CoA dehydrogenase